MHLFLGTLSYHIQVCILQCQFSYIYKNENRCGYQTQVHIINSVSVWRAIGARAYYVWRICQVAHNLDQMREVIISIPIHNKYICNRVWYMDGASGRSQYVHVE